MARKAKKEVVVVDFFANTSEKSAPKKKTGKSSLGQIKADDEKVKAAVDVIAELSPQFKVIEAELKGAKEIVNGFAKTVHAERMVNGDTANFKILSDENTVSFLAVNKCSSIYEEQLKELEEAYGDGVRDLYEKDEGSVRFNQNFLAEKGNKQKLLEALAPLGKEFIGNLFTSAQYTAVKDIKVEAANVVDKAEDLKDLYDDIALVRYVKT